MSQRQETTRLRRQPARFLTGDPQERDYRSEKFVLGTLTTITLAHDFICPWCYVGFFQARRLTEEFGVTFDWRGFELIPPEMDYTPAPQTPVDPNAPPKPTSRFDLFAEAEGLVPPSSRPTFARSHKALLGAEFALLEGSPQKLDAYLESVYRGYWTDRDDIADMVVLRRYAADAGLDADAFAASVHAERYRENVPPFDDTAYSIGIRHVPTFYFNAEENLAEAGYADLARATERFLIRSERFKEKT
jgi:predicted DsbA family dithiol-disulfide isomerase